MECMGECGRGVKRFGRSKRPEKRPPSAVRSPLASFSTVPPWALEALAVLGVLGM